MDVISAYWIYCLTFSHVSVSVLGLLHADGRFSQIIPFVINIYTYHFHDYIYHGILTGANPDLLSEIQINLIH